MLDNLEKLEKIIFQGGTFSVKNTVTLGNKNAAGNRLNPIYKRSYNSTKYNDRNTLDSIRFQVSEYIVFAVNDYERKINEEIYISYPNMQDLLNFLEDCFTVMNDPNSFPNGQPNTQIVIESESFASGKKLMAVPAIWDGKNNDIRKGLLLFLNSEDICVKLEAGAISTLCYCMGNFNLSSESNQLIMMGMLSELGENGISTSNSGSTGIGSGTSSVFSGRTNSSSTFGSGSGASKSGLRSNNGLSRRGLGGSSSTNLPTTNNNGISPNAQPEQHPESVAAETAQGAGAGKRLSMNNVIKAASEIEDLGEVEI